MAAAAGALECAALNLQHCAHSTALHLVAPAEQAIATLRMLVTADFSGLEMTCVLFVDDNGGRDER